MEKYNATLNCTIFFCMKRFKLLVLVFFELMIYGFSSLKNLFQKNFCFIRGICVPNATVTGPNNCSVCISELNSFDWTVQYDRQGRYNIFHKVFIRYKNSGLFFFFTKHKYLNYFACLQKQNLFYYFIPECKILDLNNHVESLIVAICLIGIATIFVLFLIVVLKVFKHNKR